MSDSVAFDRAAEYYDATRSITPEASREITVLLGEELAGRGRCLEIGVGTGMIALPLAEAGLPMVGIDLSEPMLRKLIEKAGGRASFPVALGDATALPFADGSFDTALARHVFHLMPAWERAIDELVRVVKPGGLILASQGGFSGPWRAVTERFMSLVGKTSLAKGLDPRDLDVLDAAFAARGMPVRLLRPVAERSSETLGQFIDQMGRGVHSWTWEFDPDTCARAAGQVREWALDRYGTLDPPASEGYEIIWRAFDRPASALPG